jgi:glycosyl hydrolase family 57
MNEARHTHLVSVLLCMSCPPEPVSRGFHRLFEQNHFPLISLLSELDRPCALSVPWGLTERWHSDGYHQVLRLCSHLRREGSTEFVASAAYYPILPLLPREAISRQVTHDQLRHAELYQDWKCAGFVPPEMAFGPELIPILAEAGFRWCAVDDATYCCLTPEPPSGHVAQCGGLKVLLRSSLWSKALVGAARSGRSGADLARDMMAGLQDWFGDRRGYVVLALDTECLGTHRGGSLNCLRDFMLSIDHSDSFQLCTPSEIVDQFPHQDDEVPPGSWRTTPDQFWEGEFFVPWQSRYVRAHSYLWELTELAVESVGKLQERLDRSLHAGFFWWDEKNHAGLPTGAARGLRTLLDVIAAAAPEDLDRALELAARLDEVAP